MRKTTFDGEQLRDARTRRPAQVQTPYAFLRQPDDPGARLAYLDHAARAQQRRADLRLYVVLALGAAYLLGCLSMLLVRSFGGW